MKRIIIVGGGASGMAAAISALRRAPHMEVIVLEQKETLGKKIPATGNGRCNLTNRKLDWTFYRGENPAFVKAGLERFGCRETERFFSLLGLSLKDRGEYVYPRNDQALAVLLLLQKELQRLGARVYTGLSVVSVKKAGKGYQILTTGEEFWGDCVILSTGGCASPVHGSNGSGFQLLRKLGHRIVPPVPALVPLEIRKFPFFRAAGVRTEGKVSLYCANVLQGEDRGEIQITKTGISGIPVFQISRYAARGLAERKPVTVKLDLLPEWSEEEFRNLIRNRKKEETATAEDLLLGLFHQRLLSSLCFLAGITPAERIAKWSGEKTEALIRVCKSSTLMVEKTKGFEGAQVCAGGADTSEIREDTMESKKYPGLYITGELQDIDGMCGGYNLQWAWTSGFLAGDAAAKALVKKESREHFEKSGKRKKI